VVFWAQSYIENSLMIVV